MARTPEPATPAPAIPAAKRPLTIMPDTHYRQRHMVWVPPGTVLEQVCDPAFWSNVTKRLNRADLIEVMPDDMAWRAVLIVRAVGRLEAVVQVVQFDPLGASDGAVPDRSLYEVRFINPDRKWGVFMRSTNELVRDEFQVREHAERYVVNHSKVMAA